MEKPPAFQLYVDDFLTDDAVELMTNEQLGAYVRLLCHAWKREHVGHLPNDDQILGGLSRQGSRWNRTKQGILRAFKTSDDGATIFQKRMVEERRKQIEFSDKQADSGRNGAAKRWGRHGKPIAPPMLPHGFANGESMAKDSSSSSSSSSSSGSSLSPAREDGTAPLGPARCDPARLQDAWLQRTGNIEHNLLEVAMLCEDAARLRSPPADPNEYADKCITAFSEWVNGISNEARRPGKSAFAFTRNFSRIQEIVSGRASTKPKDTDRSASRSPEPVKTRPVAEVLEEMYGKETPK